MNTLMREEMAALAHSQWSGWMEYLFSKCELNEDGTVTVPRLLVLRWLRQKDTAYHDLPESEKESDRHEADKVLQVFAANNLS